MSNTFTISLPLSEQTKFNRWVRSQSWETKTKIQKVVYSAVMKEHLLSVRQAPVNYGRLRASLNMMFSRNLDKPGGMVYANARYAPYQEFGTGKRVRVYPGYSRYAMQFKGRGIREVNIRPHPFFINSFELSKRWMLKELNKLGFK